MIELHDVKKGYGKRKKEDISAVQGVSLRIEQGSIHGIIGESGAGKSTLLRLMNMLERPEEGSVWFDGRELTAMRESELRKVRPEMGMIFQHFHLLHNRTVEGNVKIPLELAGVPAKEREQRAAECLAFAGLTEKAQEYPARLSGGQKQRVAIARALAANPKVLLCDEPTSSLDPKTTSGILEVLRTVNRSLGVTVVIVTHELEVVSRLCDEVTVMDQGEIADQFSLRTVSQMQGDNLPGSGVVLPDLRLASAEAAPSKSYREQLLGRREE